MPSLATTASTPLTRNQVRGFWAAWGGWALDGMDSFIYALVLTPAITELLPRSGIAATPGNVGYYGSLLFALFLFGWGCSMVWGPMADRFGRVKTLMLTILCYSVFTFLGAIVTSVWQLAVCRMLAGVGIGGEWSMGGTFVAEEWPEDRRKTGAGYMHTGYYFGFFLAAIANYFIGAQYGWRVMFAIGGLPALLVSFIRYGVHESDRWEHKVAAQAAVDDPGVRRAVLADLRKAHDPQLAVPARVGRRSVGRIGLRADVGHATRARRGLHGSGCGADGVVRNDGAVGRARSSAAWPSRRSPSDTDGA